MPLKMSAIFAAKIFPNVGLEHCFSRLVIHIRTYHSSVDLHLSCFEVLIFCFFSDSMFSFPFPLFFFFVLFLFLCRYIVKYCYLPPATSGGVHRAEP